VRVFSRIIATIPRTGPIASTPNANLQPMAWTTDGMIPIETVVIRKPMQVCSVNAVPM
jgi:hypothetical protein